MKREEIERLIVQVSTYEKGTIPFMCACDQLLSEFDRLTGQRDAYREETEGLRIDKVALTAENEKLSTKVATLQSQFDKISEPYHYSRDKAEYPWIRHEGKADGCPICRLKPLSEKLP